MESAPANPMVGHAGRSRAAPAREAMNAAEQKSNSREIESIARQLARPLAEIAELYADVYMDLKSNARILDYLPVLVARRVRARYQAEKASLASNVPKTNIINSFHPIESEK